LKYWRGGVQKDTIVDVTKPGKLSWGLARPGDLASWQTSQLQQTKKEMTNEMQTKSKRTQGPITRVIVHRRPHAHVVLRHRPLTLRHSKVLALPRTVAVSEGRRNIGER
jgi:hypothetical protein